MKGSTDFEQSAGPFYIPIQNGVFTRENYRLQQASTSSYFMPLIFPKVQNFRYGTPIYYLEEYFILEPLADATLEEVCTNLKQQVLEYINLLREQKIA